MESASAFWEWVGFYSGYAKGTAIGFMLLAAVIAVEHVAALERFTLKSRVPGFFMVWLGGSLGGLLSGPVQGFWHGLGVAPYVVIPLWSALKPFGLAGYAVQILAVLMFTDFFLYWRHRFEHTRFFWPIHAVHHSPTELHAANNIGHPLQWIADFLFVVIPLSFVQMSGPGAPVTVGLIGTVLALYIHSPIDAHFGRGRRLVVDNRFHRIHHSLEPKHFDKNFGITFSVWDWMFGTAWWPEPGEWPQVGVKEYPAPRTFWQYLVLPLHPLRVRWSARRPGGRSRTAWLS